MRRTEVRRCAFRGLQANQPCDPGAPLFEPFQIERTASFGVRCVWAGVILLFGLTLPRTSRAQFLRVGPFDFTAKAKVGLNWSDNVDGVRPVEQDKRPEDFYLVWSFDLNSATPAGRDGLLTLDAGVEAEDYFRRDDLDTADLGRIRAELTKNMRRLKLNALSSGESLKHCEKARGLLGHNIVSF